ncbi:hypothetical protein [Mycolicibacterium brisbanense]|uniref:Exported protein n=1 Tax=Mycolicibacterium brisbanense TaxID=146020 RepID=A0A117I4R0_9MYCO|nr:hypothetical protein [Mycolicibacterium brisbanense]MCV7162207.1 peptidoglycan endopeptidase [Mycolicibacterium brisbanense]GAS87347.1 exported protein [Mycolicibacterium brisbanense]
MFAIATASLMALVQSVSGTPYISGGDTPAGTDCSGLASWISNVATGRPAFGDRFNTGNQERALLARGFKYGSEPGALVIGWNGGHTAVTLPDGTPVSSGEGGRGVKIGGGGAFQRQFTHHMYLPVANEDPAATAPEAPAPFDAPPPEAPMPPGPPPMADPMAPPPADPFAPPPPVQLDVPAPPAPEAPEAPPADPFAPPMPV